MPKLDEQERMFCPQLRFGGQRTCAHGLGRTISPEYQQRFCLTAGFSQCPLYTGPRLPLRAPEPAPPATPAPPVWPAAPREGGRRAGRRHLRPLVAGYAISAALALGAVAGTLWQLTSEATPGAPAAPTPAITATAAAQPGALAAPATATPTPTPAPTQAPTAAPAVVTPAPVVPLAAPPPSPAAATAEPAPAPPPAATVAPVTPAPVPAPVTPAASAAPTTPAPRETTYTVQPGDTLNAIAQRFHVSIDALIQRNQIADPNVITPGAVLHIPNPG
ncbi:MAG TPA: LysM domain-containing protein [Thermomicrobiaceae bacterium]|nr:LysM domain-containing protein [Thermomicrobiaceae bacterium]